MLAQCHTFCHIWGNFIAVFFSIDFTQALIAKLSRYQLIEDLQRWFLKGPLSDRGMTDTWII